MKIRTLAIFTSLIFLLLGFQNCSFYSSVQTELGVSKVSGAGAMNSGGGQPYDGMTYISKAQCPDGTLVGSRVLISGPTTTMYRRNCQTIPPQVIDPSEIQVINSNNLVVSQQAFALETPSIPLPGFATWFMQLTGNLISMPSQIYLVDMFGTDASTISQLVSENHTVICVISAGTRESWNPDAGNFLPADIGLQEQGGPGENWIDTRSANVRSIMLARLDLAKSKGCQGIDFDAVDGYENKTGFPLSETTQLDYNQYLAFAAHDRALIMTINGVASLAVQMSKIFDLAVAEQCFDYQECGGYQSFISLGKPVLAIEYGPVNQSWCSQAQALDISLEFYNQNLDGTGFATCR